MHTSEHRIRDDYLAAILEPDPFRAREIAREAVDGGLSLAELYSEVFQPAMVEIGDRWEAGTISVAHEHLAAEVTASLISDLAQRVRRSPEGGRLAIVSCSPGERHSIGGQMLSGLLEASGWEVLYLGATLPIGDLVGLADSEVPDVVALSTTMSAHLPEVREAVPALHGLPEPPLVALGGQAYRDEQQARELGADVWAPTAAAASALLDEEVRPA
ncbi:MAG TPA: B12-binding domain-containing protein [Thermoleophilaceae bacterium]|nr:B12-binding domain-containing protein [Thermoleophilaceae bacterium]